MMNRITGLVLAFCLALTSLPALAQTASTTVYDLGAPVLGTNEARLSVTAEFLPADLLEVLIGFQLDATGSSANVAADDYTRLSFELDPALTTDWLQLSDFGDNIDTSPQATDAIDTGNFGLAASPPAHLLGDIVVDTSGLEGQVVKISIMGPDTTAESVDSQFAIVDNQIDFVNGMRQFTVPGTPPTTDPAPAVPEPATATLGLIGAMAVAMRRKRKTR